MGEVTKNFTVSKPSVSPARGALLVQEQRRRVEKLLEKDFTVSEYSIWQSVTRTVLEEAFGKNSPHIDKVLDYGAEDKIGMWDPMRDRRTALMHQCVVLQGMVDILSEAPACKTSSNRRKSGGTEVFLVHGHTDCVHEVSRFIEQVGLKAIVLREQPNQGRTVIEKFEDYADVGFAVVLLTPDDRAGTSSKAFEMQKPRARQNVIFELGYFIASLGRERVSALYVPGVEILSDYAGVLYHELDSHGGWKTALAKELRAVGFKVDMNRL